VNITVEVKLNFNDDRLVEGQSGFPLGIEKILNFKTGFQDLEKVLNLAKMYIRS